EVGHETPLEPARVYDVISSGSWLRKGAVALARPDAQGAVLLNQVGKPVAIQIGENILVCRADGAALNRRVETSGPCAQRYEQHTIAFRCNVRVAIIVHIRNFYAALAHAVERVKDSGLKSAADCGSRRQRAESAVPIAKGGCHNDRSRRDVLPILD